MAQRKITDLLVRAPAFEFVCDKIITLCTRWMLEEASRCFIQLEREEHLFIKAVDALVIQLMENSQFVENQQENPIWK